MKKNICLLFAVFFLVTLCACGKAFYTELGIPLSERYPEGIRARLPWDMIVWDGKLYVGSGDYDANSGPIDMWCYNIEDGTWEMSGTLPDEEVNRFCIINGTLTAPGIDPKEDWELGNYYQLIDGAWEKQRVIPGGIHNFDMVEYDGAIFCGLGVVAGEYPIARSTDGGKSAEQVKMYRDGAPVDTNGNDYVRVYDLFVFDETLYAAYRCGNTELSYDLYRYEGGVFVYDSTLNQKMQRIKTNYKFISEKVEFGSQMFFATGHLYATSDMNTFTKIEFSEGTVVYDIAKYGGSLYALCATPSDEEKYEISVWKNDGKKASDFSEVFSFTYDIPPVSFAIDESEFYIGMGDFTSDNDKNGMIIKAST